MNSPPNRSVLAIFAIVVLCGIEVTSPCPLFAQDVPKWAQESQEKWYAAFNAGDAAALVEQYAADAVVLLLEQTLRGRDAIYTFQETQLQKSRFVCTWGIDGVHALDKLAVVWGHDSCTETPKAGGASSTRKGRWLMVYEVQSDGSWVIVRDGWQDIGQ